MPHAAPKKIVRVAVCGLQSSVCSALRNKPRSPSTGPRRDLRQFQASSGDVVVTITRERLGSRAR